MSIGWKNRQIKTEQWGWVAKIFDSSLSLLLKILAIFQPLSLPQAPTNIIEESTFVLESTYQGSLEECKQHKRTLDLKIMVQIRKGLEPLNLLISEFDEEYFKITLTLRNHSKSNEFGITFNEHSDIQIFPNAEHSVNSLLPKLDRLNFSNPLDQLIQFLAARLNFSWIIYERDSKQRSQNDRFGCWEFNEMLITKLLQFAKPDGLSTYQYILSAVYRSPIIIHDLSIKTDKKGYYNVEINWLNEQPAPPLNPTLSRMTTHSRESNTAFSGTVDIKQNYKRQWYIDLEIFQEAQILESQMLFEQHKIDQQKLQQQKKTELDTNWDSTIQKTRSTDGIEAGTEANDFSQEDHETHSICSSDIQQIQNPDAPQKLSARTRSILSATGPRISFTNNAIFYGASNTKGRIEGNEYGEITTNFEFILAVDNSHYNKNSIFKVQAKIILDSEQDFKANTKENKILQNLNRRDQLNEDVLDMICKDGKTPQNQSNFKFEQGFSVSQDHGEVNANSNNAGRKNQPIENSTDASVPVKFNDANNESTTKRNTFLNIENYTNRMESEITAKGGSLLYRGGMSHLNHQDKDLLLYKKESLYLNEKLFNDYQKEDEFYLSETVPLII